MKDMVSDESFYLECDEDEVKHFNKGEEDGDDSDFSNFSDDNQPSKKPDSHHTAWPQRNQWIFLAVCHHRQYHFWGGSFLLNRRHTPKILPTLNKPFLSNLDDQTESKNRRDNSHSLLPPLPRKGSRRISSRMSSGLPVNRNCSYGQAVLNGMNVLCGVGILSTPYAVKEGGWSGLAILFIFSVLSFYTGILLRYCLDSKPGLETYPDIGQAAFGNAGRFAISIILYAELYASCVEYIILESDNLSSLFPNAYLNFGGIYLNSSHLFGILATLTILPTVWVKDLRVLSYISAGGVVASILVVVCLFWVGLVDKVGFESKGSVLNLNTLPVAIGLYGYCYSGHAVLPNIYTSMKKRSEYPAFLFSTFGICTLMYMGVAVTGYMMFGESTLSQFTLNMPRDLIASKIAVWIKYFLFNVHLYLMFLFNPFTKYALTMTPVAMSLEELIPSQHLNYPIYSILIRSTLVISTLLVGLFIPFFGLVMSLIGSFLTMLTLILPCACYLSILKGKINFLQASFCTLVIAVGLIASGFGTCSALTEIIKQWS